ncbi:hypothetical protein GC101_27745 [Paenibacillus sp. LMG 31459]|uniref:Lipoprotein n=1 Tax=Paenibacillus phytohabitans TaxID=2654978 RepID=A0ABX1YNM0_9BACL|nr:hypothetical protein [Paenibacillus phytohabitans]NOU82660.1 hypothetical protein [Paenibacillus phytohabitans]
MNKIKLLASVSIVAALILGSCSNDKAGNAVTSTTPTSTQDSKTADYWAVVNKTTWTDNFDGLKTTIDKIVISDEVPLEGSIKSAVGVNFIIENTTKETFTTHPDQAVLVTSTGEQIDADMSQSEDIGGEIYEGATKKGGDSEITQDNQNKYDVKIEF